MEHQKVPPLELARKGSKELFKKIGTVVKIIPSAVFPQTLYYRVILGELTRPEEKFTTGMVGGLLEASYLGKSS
jgi:hypothetical protein